MPEGEDVQSLARRVVSFFETANSRIDMSAEARAVFTGLQACCNTRGALLRNGADDNGSAARAGCAPWHIAMLAAANLIWELSIEETTQVQIQDHHILRAWEQVQVSHALVDIGCQQEAFAKVEDSGAWTLSAAQKLAAAQEAGRLPTSQFGAFEAVEDDDVLAEAGEELPALLTIMDPDVPALTCGYGENGASVQDPALGEVVMSDRVLQAETSKPVCKLLSFRQVPGSMGSFPKGGYKLRLQHLMRTFRKLLRLPASPANRDSSSEPANPLRSYSTLAVAPCECVLSSASPWLRPSSRCGAVRICRNSVNLL